MKPLYVVQVKPIFPFEKKEKTNLFLYEIYSCKVGQEQRYAITPFLEESRFFSSKRQAMIAIKEFHEDQKELGFVSKTCLLKLVPEPL